MSEQLGRVEDLPKDYYDGLVSRNTLPLWPSLRAMLPHGMPGRRTQPVMWRYQDVRPDLIKAGELTPIEKAERRVLVLCNPGLGLQNMQATASIYIGLQLIQPGETAPNHRHTPSAVRFVIEGEGGFTVVNGEKLPMEKGDLILTPPGLWHEHGHEGRGPVIWLDALDLPLIYGIDASYSTEAQRGQPLRKATGDCNLRYAQGGVVPYAALDDKPEAFPLLRFPWKDVRAALQSLARVTPAAEPVQLAYVNPHTGRECLATLGFSAILLRPGESLCMKRRSASAVLHVVEGAGQAQVDGATHDFGAADTLALPTHAQVTLTNGSATGETFLFMVDDAPLHRKLGIYEVFE
jgi:gentisate 1,2-dioxygenase